MKELMFTLFIILGLLVMPVVEAAEEQKVINFSKESPDKKKDFFLFANEHGSYFLRHWQIDTAASWTGEGEVNMSVKQAVDTSYQYLGFNRVHWGIAEVTLRPAFNFSNTIIWYYIVELTKLPYKFGAETKKVVVLTSGEVVLPNVIK
ncbi:hypothetical protein AADZ91_17710 [Colwelliaceae bacterium 6441]